MKCPYCGASASRVVSTTQDSKGGTRRRRECLQCGRRFSTYELPVDAMPLVVKSGGYRESFDRYKLIKSIRTACAKRPVPLAAIERLVGRIEDRIRQMNRTEISSHVIGDMVVDELMGLDEIAYIRYVIVYKELDSLVAVYEEIGNLLARDGRLQEVSPTGAGAD